MPYVVTDNCTGCRFTDCVEVCPVDCFWGDDQMLYIDPDVCIDCGACEPVCPVEAIYPEEDLPAEKEKYAAINAERSQADDTVNITETQAPLPGADARKATLGF